MNKLITHILLLVSLVGCSLGPNPNPGERTVDSLISRKEYQKALSRLNKKIDTHPWAQLRFAVLLEEGAGGEKDIIQALWYYKLVAKQWGDDPWSMGDMYGAAMFGNFGYYKQNNNALFAQYKLAEIYFEGKYVEKDLLKAYLLINNILSKSKEIHEFQGVYCCEYARYQYAPLETIQNKLKSIADEMSASQKQEAAELISTWTPQDYLE